MSVPTGFSLAGKTALVTGATGLLGQRHCEALLSAGATVIATDLSAARCEELAQRLGPNIHAVEADVTNPRTLVQLRTHIQGISNRLDVIVNNAALNDAFESPLAALELSRFEAYPLELWQRSLEVNVTGVFLVCQALGPLMVQQRSGSIINIASTYGLVGPDQALYRNNRGEQLFYKSPVYPASKGAVLAFTRYLACYWGHAQVRVNALTPGGVENNQDREFIEHAAARTPLGRMAQPADFMGALLFLASDASSYVTGANIVVDGGFTVW